MFSREPPLKYAFATLQADLQGDTTLINNYLHQFHLATFHSLSNARIVSMSDNQLLQFRVFGQALLHHHEQGFDERNVLLCLGQFNAALHPGMAHLFVFGIAHKLK